MKERISLAEHGFCPSWDQDCFGSVEELRKADNLHKLRVAAGQEDCICGTSSQRRKTRRLDRRF